MRRAKPSTLLDGLLQNDTLLPTRTLHPILMGLPNNSLPSVICSVSLLCPACVISPISSSIVPPRMSRLANCNRCFTARLRWR